MFAVFIDRDAGSRESWIGEGADGDAYERSHTFQFVIKSGAALRAEVEGAAPALVADADIFRRGPRDDHVLAGKPGLLPEHAAGPPLARQTMADGDAYRFAGDLGCELAAATGGSAGGHAKLSSGTFPVYSIGERPGRSP